MATWEQSNAGGLLAGIGGNNANAPQSGDVNATLSMIRDNNDRQRSGANNVGLQALQGISSVTQMYKQNQQQEQQQEFQKAYGSAYASGDRSAMRQLAAQYPAQMESVQKGMGFIDDDQRATVGNLAASARLAASNSETFTKWLKNNASDLDRAGIDPQHVAQIYQQDPKGFGDFADHLGLAAIGPDKYFDIQDKIVGRQIDQGKLNETVRSNKAGENLTSRGQDITLRGQNITAQNAALDREIKRSEIQDKVLDRQISRETNQAKLGELKLKQQEARNKSLEAKQGFVDTYNTQLDGIGNSITTAKDLLSDPNFEGTFGFSGKINRNIPGAAEQGTWSKVQAVQAQARMQGMQGLRGLGAASEQEGKAAANALLSIDESTPPAQAKKAIEKWVGILDKQQKRLATSGAKRASMYQQEIEQNLGPSSPQEESTGSVNWSDLK
ncbi:phage DNA ejection protein [Yersinia enterocolitica]|uniref:phage DNA ejection protein n=1 Tax=Yersinia enterocolitica TaxID=630 RepID=UPI0009780F6D|nr:phage DNA ejection protein [Yersinia enterocolitica]